MGVPPDARGSTLARESATPLGAPAADIFDASVVVFFFDEPARHQIIDHGLEAKNRYQVVAVRFELLPRPLLAVQKDENVPHRETGVRLQEGSSFDDPSTAGH